MAAVRLIPRKLTVVASQRPRLAGGLAAMLLGALAACGFQPLALWPLTILAVALLIELLSRAGGRKQTFVLGWLFGVGHFVVGNAWIATAFTYQSEMPAWLGGIAVLGLALYLALFPALAALAAWSLVRWSASRHEAGMPWLGLALAGCWIVSEWMRGRLFTGFAWNPLGIALLGPFDTPGLAVLAPWTGTYGLSGVLILIAGGARRLVRASLFADRRQRAALAFGSVTLAALLAALISAPATWIERREGGRVFTLVQPNIRQDHINEAMPRRIWCRRWWRIPAAALRKAAGAAAAAWRGWCRGARFLAGTRAAHTGFRAMGQGRDADLLRDHLSGEVVDPRNRPDFIFNPSNDGWFGAWGPPQHLAQTRLRAIEEGLPVLRATTTGISAVIDADGVVRQLRAASPGRADRRHGMIPPRTSRRLFARLGNMLSLVWAVASCCRWLPCGAGRARARHT
jgi:apolipoprotein N-acyltransferase